MENGTGPCGAGLECGNCNGLWRSAARLNRVETLQIHKACESESLQLSFLTAREKKSILQLLDKHVNVPRNVTGKEHEEPLRQSKRKTLGLVCFFFAIVLFNLFFLAKFLVMLPYWPGTNQYLQ